MGRPGLGVELELCPWTICISFAIMKDAQHLETV